MHNRVYRRFPAPTDAAFAAIGFLIFAASGFPPLRGTVDCRAATPARKQPQRTQSTQSFFLVQEISAISALSAVAFPLRMRLRNAPHAEVLDLEELLEAVLRSFAAEPGLLHAAERRDLGRDD